MLNGADSSKYHKQVIAHFSSVSCDWVSGLIYFLYCPFKILPCEHCLTGLTHLVTVCSWLINRYRGRVEHQSGKKSKKKKSLEHLKCSPHSPHCQTVCDSWHLIIQYQHLKWTLSSVKPTGWLLFHLVWFYSQQSFGFDKAVKAGAACVQALCFSFCPLEYACVFA